MIVDVLPLWERCTYWIVGISGMAYSVYMLFLEGDNYKNKLVMAPLQPGWSWLGRKQDKSDSELWVYQSFLPKFIFLVTIHVLISQICFYFKVGVKLHSCILLVYDIIAACFLLGVRLILMQFCLAIIVYAVSHSGSIFLAWLMELTLVSSLNYRVIYKMQISYLQMNSFENEYTFNVQTAFVYIRFISFALDKIKYRKSQASLTRTETQAYTDIGEYEHNAKWKSDDSIPESREQLDTDVCHHKKIAHESCDETGLLKSTNSNIVDCDPSFLDLLFYTFYLPTLMNGPIFIYRDFHNQVKSSFQSSNFTPDVYDIAKQLIRITFWAVFIEFYLHFLYHNALGEHPELLKSLSVWALVAAGYFQGQLFMIKYYVLYGANIQLSRFDGVVPLARPRCVAWVHSFTDIWKYFDVGLYNFIKTYIYIPMGGSKAGLLQKIFALSLAFMFVGYWHGAQKYILIWCAGNFLMCSMETAVLSLEQCAIGEKLKSFLSPAAYLRLKALIIAPAYVISCLQIYYFFFRMEAGHVFVSKMATGASWTTLLTEWVIFTACVHNSIYVTRWYTNKKNIFHDTRKMDTKLKTS